MAQHGVDGDPMKRYEREIAELLEKMDDFIPDKAPRRKKRAPNRRIRRLIRLIQSLNITPTTDITPTSLIIASVVLAFLAYLFHDFFRPVAPLASVASVCLLLAALAMSIIRRRRQIQRRWRGRVIELDNYRSGSFFARLRYRWRRIWKNLWQKPGGKY